MRKQILFAIFSLATLIIHADEGMWMLPDLKTQNEIAMRELGLEIPIEEVYNANGLSLKDAVVHFGGGCTGEVISSEGLVLTKDVYKRQPCMRLLLLSGKSESIQRQPETRNER